MSSNPIQLPAKAFSDLLAAVAPFASRDRVLPTLCTVRLEARDGYLIATATDRYRVGIARTYLSGDGGQAAGPVLVDSADVKTLIADTKKAQLVEVTFGSGSVTIGGFGGTRTVATVDADYPKVESIVRDALGRTQNRTRVMAINPKLFADFDVIAKQTKQVPSCWLSDTSELMAVTCGEDFVGAIMLPKPGLVETDGYVGAGWDGLLAGTPTAPAMAVAS